MIEIRRFTKRYGDFLAVQPLDLTIGPGEMFGFIGPNGAGKSTTIRFLVTLLKPTGGDAQVAGYSVTRQPLDVRRMVGYMPDNFGVYDGMKVWEFLDFFAVAYQLPRGKRRAVIADVLELLDLTAKREAFVNGLSRGMKQRLCLAKTLLHDPPVLILDEPTSGLDPRARMEVKALLRELRKMGKTILISSHILSELADCCTSVGIIERGKLLVAGPLDQVFRHHQRHRVIELRVLNDAENAAAVLRQIPETQSVQVEGSLLTAELSADDEQLAQLLEQLQAAGVRLVSFADKPPTLEELFLRVTVGAVN